MPPVIEEKLKEHPDQPLLWALKDQDTKAIKRIYDGCFPHIHHWISNNGGSRSDAEDVFQDCLETLYMKMRSEKILVLSCTLATFMHSMARNQWFKKLRRKGKMTVLKNEDDVLGADLLSDEMDKRERLRFYREKFKQLGQDCKNILTLFYNGTSMNEIADKMGFASPGYAKKKKHVCKKKLIVLIKADQRFKEFTDANI